MKNYQPKTPRATIAFAAAAMTALNLALSVVGPASIASANQAGGTVVTSQPATSSQHVAQSTVKFGG